MDLVVLFEATADYLSYYLRAMYIY